TGEATKLVRETHLHMIADEDVLGNLGVASKMNGEIAFLEYLKNVGRARADAWLTTNFEAIGSRSTINLYATLGRMELSENRYSSAGGYDCRITHQSKQRGSTGLSPIRTMAFKKASDAAFITSTVE